MKIITLTREEFKNKKKGIKPQEKSENRYGRCPFCKAWLPLEPGTEYVVQGNNVVIHAQVKHPMMTLNYILSSDGMFPHVELRDANLVSDAEIYHDFDEPPSRYPSRHQIM